MVFNYRHSVRYYHCAYNYRVILERVGVMFAFPFGIFAIILIASAFSVDEGKQKPKKPQKKTKKQIAEEQYVSPFFC
ncbi:MAG: hypothetical protein LIO41_01690 [Ruminococcus sp.]|nr:hypothetical protein [Ruminococcus sp.]